MHQFLKEIANQVERAGGRMVRSRDGHLKVLDRDGRFVVKIRTGGVQTERNGAFGRSVRAKLRRAGLA